MLRKNFVGSTPPCEVCPKNEGVQESDRKPLPEELDFGDWFTDLHQFYRERRAIGYGSMDPLMAAVMAEFHDWFLRGEQDNLTMSIVLGILSARKT